MTSPCHHMSTGDVQEPYRPKCKSGSACPWFPAYAARLMERVLAEPRGSAETAVTLEAKVFIRDVRSVTQ